MIQEHAPLRQEDQFRELFGVLRRRKAIVALTTLGGAALGVVSILLATPSYQVTNRLLIRDYVNTQTGRPSDPIDQLTQAGIPLELGAQVGLLGSPFILGQALQKANVAPPAETAEPPVGIGQEAGGPVLDISVNLPNGDDATRLAQAIPDTFNAYITQDGKDRADGAIKAANDRLTAAKAAAATSEAALNKELTAQGPKGELVSESGEEGSIRTGRLNGYVQQLDAAKIGLATAETQLRESIAARDAIPATIKDTNFASAAELARDQKQKLSDLQGQLRALLVTQTEGSPDVKALRATIAQTTSYLGTLPVSVDRTGTIRNPDRLSYDQRVIEQKIGLQASKVQIAKLQANVDREQAGLADFQRRLPRQHLLQADLEQKRGTVASAAQAVASLESLVAKAHQPLQPLGTPSAPVKTQPVIARTIISSTLLGLVLGAVLALLRDRFDNRVYTLEQIYDVSGAVPIGSVSTSAKALGPNVGGQSRNRVLESYRSLRFNLESSAEGGAAQSVLIVSASAGEGRAGLSLNLATEAATDARKTILVDADMRTPELHDVLKLQRGPGLSDVLSGTTDLESVLQQTAQENLLFLSAGSEHALPLELLTGPSFVALHEALKERADVIVLNSPSLMRYTDGRAIARVADSVLFVAKRGFTRRDAMRYCIGMLRRTKARILGVVLSDDTGRPTDVPYYATE